MTDPFDPAAIAAQAMQEFKYRLDDPARRAKISDTVLVKFSSDAIRLAEQQARDAEREANMPRDILDVIQTTELSPERKDLIVEAEIRRLEERIMRLRLAKEKRYE